MNTVKTEIGEGLKVVVLYLYHPEEKPTYHGRDGNPGSPEEYEICSVLANDEDGPDILDTLNDKWTELMRDACVNDRLSRE